MLRTPEPRPGEAGAASCSPRAVPPTQSKPLTSFLIQDILREGADRRAGHAGSPQPPRQPDRRRDPEPEPEGGRGGAGAPEDQPRARPRAARGEAEQPAETEPGMPARLGRPGWAGVGPLGREGRSAGRTGVRAGAGWTSGSPAAGMRGPAATGEGTSRPPPRARLGD